MDILHEVGAWRVWGRRKEEIVLNAIIEGFDNETITKLTKLSIKEIEALRKTNT